MSGDDLRHLLARFPRQEEEVVAPVGGGRLVDRTPDQAPGLGGQEVTFNFCYYGRLPLVRTGGCS